MARRRKKAPAPPKKSPDEKRQRKIQIIMGVVLVLLMVMSVGGIFFSPSNNNSNSNKLTYGGHTFTIEPLDGTNQYVYVTQINKQKLFFYNLPQDTLFVNVKGNFSKLVSNASFVVLTGNMSSRYASLYDSMRFQVNQLGKQVVLGGTVETNATSDLYGYYTCDNATAQMPVIQIVNSNVTQINVVDSCVQVTVQQQNLGAVRDRILYTLLGIIKE